MKSHKFEVEVEVTHFDKNSKIKNTYFYPYDWEKNDEITIEVSEGNKQIQTISFPVRSFVEGFGRQFTCFFANQNSNITKVDTTTVATSIDTISPLNINAPAGSGSFGMWVGIGHTTVTFTDVLVPDKIVSGNSAGQLLYGDTTFGSSSVTATGYKITVQRLFTNNSGADIRIRETGIIAQDSSNNQYLILHDRISKTGVDIDLTVSNGQTANVTYAFYVDSTGYLNENFLKGLYSSYSGLSTPFKTTMFDTAGSQSIQFNTGTNWAVGAVSSGIDTWGIVVGSGSMSINPGNTYKLASQIQHGTNVGNLSYETGDGEAILITGASASVIFKRKFINNTPSASVIKELGVYMHGEAKSGGNFVNSSNNKICILRIPVTPIDLAVSDSILVRYLCNLKAIN